MSAIVGDPLESKVAMSDSWSPDGVLGDRSREVPFTERATAGSRSQFLNETPLGTQPIDVWTPPAEPAGSEGRPSPSVPPPRSFAEMATFWLAFLGHQSDESSCAN